MNHTPLSIEDEKAKLKHDGPKLAVVDKILNFFKEEYLLIGVLLLGIFLRVKWFFMESIWNDASLHLWYAVKSIQDPLFILSSRYLMGDYVTIQFLYPIVNLFVGDIFISAKIVALFYSIVGIIAIYFLGKKLYNKSLGAISALIFSSHYLMVFYGIRPLADAVLATFIVLTMYFFVSMEKSKTFKIRYGLLAAFSLLCALATKKQAIIILIPFLLYLLIHKRNELIRNKAYQIFSGVAIGLPFFVMAIADIVFKRAYYQTLFVSKLISLEGMTTGFEVIKLLPWVITWPILIFSILSFLLVIILKKKQFYIFYYVIIVYSIWFEFGNRSTLDRYLLLLLPLFSIIAGYAFLESSAMLFEILRLPKWINSAIVFILILIFVSGLINTGTNIIEPKIYSYTGYQEAGDWIKNNLDDSDLLYTGSPRSIRAFSEREWQEFADEGEPYLINLREDKYRENQSLFEEEINEYKKSGTVVYLEIDIWEYLQPSWYYPITQESIDYFQNLGFVVVNIIDRPSSGSSAQKQSVIVIFKLEN